MAKENFSNMFEYQGRYQGNGCVSRITYACKICV